MTDQERNDVAQVTAALDQVAAASRDMARCVATYYKELLDGGFEKEHAVQLAAGYQASLLTVVFFSNPPGGGNGGADG